MKKYKIENNDYELIKDYKNGFDYDAIKERYTEYFDDLSNSNWKPIKELF